MNHDKSFKMCYALNGDRLIKKIAKTRTGCVPNKPTPTPTPPPPPPNHGVNKEGVHRTHCCVAHGCKYGDRNCPVETGKIKQDYVCEECEWDGINNLEDLQRYVVRSMNDEVPLVSEENFVKLYGSKPVIDLQEKVPVSLDLLQRVWHEMYRNSPEDNLVEFQDTIDEVIELLDTWHALPKLNED